jgi:hypothetical protein
MATANHLQARAEKQYYAGFSGDLDFFLDLSSLASPWEKFLEDLARIRTEFWWASEVAFCSIQLQILENFAKDDVRLYRRAETSEKWRDAATANLKRCVTELQKKNCRTFFRLEARQSMDAANRKKPLTRPSVIRRSLFPRMINELIMPSNSGGFAVHLGNLGNLFRQVAPARSIDAGRPMSRSCQESLTFTK